MARERRLRLQSFGNGITIEYVFVWRFDTQSIASRCSLRLFGSLFETKLPKKPIRQWDIYNIGKTECKKNYKPIIVTVLPSWNVAIVEGKGGGIVDLGMKKNTESNASTPVFTTGVRLFWLESILFLFLIVFFRWTQTTPMREDCLDLVALWSALMMT